MQHRRCGFGERAIVPFFGNPDTIPRTSRSIPFTSFIQTQRNKPGWICRILACKSILSRLNGNHIIGRVHYEMFILSA